VKPQSKNALAIAVLLVVAAVLGLYAYFGVMKTEERESKRKEETEKLFSAPAAKSQDGGTREVAFRFLTVKAKGDTTVLEKQNDEWRITSPVAAKADKFAVEQIISQLTTAKFKSTVEENPTESDLAKYGLKEPKFVITARGFMPDEKGQASEDPARRREVTLYGGIENTFDGSVYLRRDGDKAVHDAEGSVRFSLEKGTFDLRDKDVLALEEAAINRVEVKGRSHPYALEREGGKGWQLKIPKVAPADAQAVGSLFSELRNARAVAFLTDSPQERKRAGVESPAAEATFALSSGEKVRVRFAVKAADGGSNAYVLREQGATAVLAEIPASAVSAVDKDPLELRDKSVLSLKREEVAQLRFSPGGGGPDVLLQKLERDGGTGEDWQVIQPEKGPAKKWKVSSLLWGLSSLKASNISEENPKDWSKYGISQGSREITAMDAQGKLLGRLQLGKEVKGNAASVYARGSALYLFEIENSKLSDLPFKVDDILDRPASKGDAGHN
jgi:hypothetical protein